VSSDLKWADNVDAIVSNAASRVHFLKQLKRAGVPIKYAPGLRLKPQPLSASHSTAHGARVL